MLQLLIRELAPGEPVEFNTRPSWLVNPATGQRLELDIFFPLLRLAIEHNGPLHWTDPVQRRRDQTKFTLCYAHGVQVRIIGWADWRKPNKLATRLAQWLIDARRGGKITGCCTRRPSGPFPRGFVHAILPSRWVIPLQAPHQPTAYELANGVSAPGSPRARRGATGQLRRPIRSQHPYNRPGQRSASEPTPEGHSRPDTRKPG